jgi:fibronectin type 3 domain-containing protein
MLKKTLKRLNVLFALVVALSGCDPEFDDKPSANFENFENYKKTSTPPAAPTGVTATALSATSIRISWSAVSGADGYVVYCSDSLNGEYLKLNDEFPKEDITSYVDEDCELDETWYYKVASIKNFSTYGYITSLKSSPVYATTTNTPSGSAPSAPTGVTATVGSSSSITVSWSSVSGATSYKVYRATSASDSYTYIEDSTSTSYTDAGLSANTTYYYKVSASNGYGESAQSSSTYATTSGSSSGSAPSAPTGITATAASSSSITVSWSSVSGATSYKVYRATSVSDSYTYIEDSTSTSYTDAGLSANTTYYYKVSASNGYGESAQSSSTSATTSGSSSGSAPSAPTGVTATRLSANSVLVTWNVVSGATGYEVYWAYTASGTYAFDGAVTSTSFTSTDWGADESGYFKVRAVNSVGSSGYSSIVSFGPYSSGGSAPNAPTGVSAMAESSSSITVSWDSVSGATGYYIYRTTSSYDSYSYSGYSTSTSYMDIGLSADTTYYYKVSASNSYGEGVQSSYVSATTLSDLTALIYGYWTDGAIYGGEQYYYFYATAGSSYTVFWNDSYQGDGLKTCDVKVAAYWSSDNTNIFNNKDSGYTSGETFTASRTGYVTLMVEPYSNGYTGTFAIKYQ